MEASGLRGLCRAPEPKAGYQSRGGPVLELWLLRSCLEKTNLCTFFLEEICPELELFCACLSGSVLSPGSMTDSASGHSWSISRCWPNSACIRGGWHFGRSAAPSE